MTSALMPTHAATAFLPTAVEVPAFVDPASRPACSVAIGAERGDDVGAREALLDRAFGPSRFAKTCERLRADRLPAAGLSLVATTGGLGADAAPGGRSLVGTVRLWHVDAGGVPALMLGPLAVEDAWRGHRVGGRLMEAAIERAGALGHHAIVLVGDAPYYARFGFERRLAQRLRMPGPVEAGRFLGLELVPGVLAGARGPVGATGAIDLAARHGSRREPACMAAA